MPYASLDELPDAVKALPKRAQEIWLEAYNAAWNGYNPKRDKYYDPNKSEQENKERYAASVAWSVVRQTGLGGG